MSNTDHLKLRIELEFNPAGSIFVHLRADYPIPEELKFRRLREVGREFKTLCEELSKEGVNELYTLEPYEDLRANHFAQMFGFKPIVSFGDSILYRKEI
jgi:hypothetical protein